MQKKKTFYYLNTRKIIDMIIDNILTIIIIYDLGNL